MSKYSEDFKVSVARKYLDDKIPVLEPARELEINRSLTLLRAKKYNANGFINTRGKTTACPSEFKVKVLDCQAETGLSDRGTAMKYGQALVAFLYVNGEQLGR